MSSLGRASRRHLLRHPGQLALCLLGIGLGIAAVIAIDIALIGAERSFERSVTGVIGNSTHAIVAGTSGIDEEIYRALRVEHGVRSIAPIVEGEVRIIPPPEGVEESSPLAARPVRTILGIDIYAEAGFRPIAGSEGEGEGRSIVTTPGGVVLERSAAEALGFEIGDTIDLQVGGRRKSLTLVGTWRAADELTRRGAARLLGVDIATAQEVLDRRGLLDRIDVRLDVAGAPTAAELATLLPAGVELRPASERTESFEGMTRAFRFNLQALGLLSLIVGVFLIHHTVTVSVLGRRMLWGRMRAAGVSRGEIVRLVLGEALFLGVIGSAIGVGCGLLLGQGLMEVVRRTIEDLYVSLGPDSVPLPPSAIAKAVALGITASVLSALPPALEASRADLRPVLRRSALEGSARRGSWVRGGIALLLALVSWLAISIPGGGLTLGYGSLLTLLLAFACITPLATRALVTLLLRGIGRRGGLICRMALRGITAQLSRTGLAIAALAVAISMSIGVQTMITSFRTTLGSWLEETLPADVYLSAPGAVARQGMRIPLPAEVERACAEHPATERVIANRFVELPGPEGNVRIAVLSPDTPTRLGVPLETSLDSGPGLERWLDGTPPGLLASEPFARKYDVATGDRIPLGTPAGTIEFEVLGVFRDYSSDLGYLAMTRTTFERFASAPGSTSIAIYLKAGNDPIEVADQLRNELAHFPGLLVRPTASLRESTLEVFDRTFQVTEVIRWLAVIVAAVGIFGALVTLELERVREIGVLRAFGLTRGEWSAVVLTQTAGLGAIAGLIALPLGVASAALLAVVVNERSFGWTIDLTVTAAPLLRGLLISIGAALAAGVVPAIRMSRIPISEALREDES